MTHPRNAAGPSPVMQAASACHDTVRSMKGLGGVLTIADGRSSIGTVAGGGNARAPGLLSLSIVILIILYKHQLFTSSSSSFCRDTKLYSEMPWGVSFCPFRVAEQH